MSAKLTFVFFCLLAGITAVGVAYIAFDYYQRLTAVEEVPAVSTQTVPAQVGEEASDTPTPEAAPSESQVEALEYLGIDAESIKNVTPEQEACFMRTLGAERVAAIKAGAVPGAMDLVRARECI